MLLWNEMTWIPLAESWLAQHFRVAEGFDANSEEVTVWELLGVGELIDHRQEQHFRATRGCFYPPPEKWEHTIFSRNFRRIQLI